MTGNDISDLTPVLSLKKLKSLDMSNNMLTEIPDLSQLTCLSDLDLDWNFLTEETLKIAYIPTAVFENDPDFMDRTLNDMRGEPTLLTAPTYYNTGIDSDGNTLYTIIIKGTDFRYSDQAVLTVTIDGNSYSSSSVYLPSQGSYQYFMVKNIPVDTSSSASKTVSATFKTTTGTTVLEDKTFETSFETKEVDQHINVLSRTDTSDNAYVYISAADYAKLGSSSQLGKFEVVDKDGNSVLLASSAYTVSNSSDNRYSDIFEGYLNTGYKYYQAYTYSLSSAKYPDAGTYDIVLTGKNNQTVKIENAVQIVGDSDKVISDIRSYTYLDSTGEYVYIAMDGQNFDPAKVHPEFTDSEGIKALDFVSQIYNTVYETYVLKYKKVGTKWEEDTTLDLNYTIEIPSDVLCTVATSGTLYVGNSEEISAIHYNYKTGHTEFYLPESYTKGKEVTVSLYEYSDYARENLVAQATATVDENSMASLDFKADGKSYIPAYKDSNKQRRILVTCDGENDLYIQRIRWYNYDPEEAGSESSTGYSYLSYYPIRTTDDTLKLNLGFSAYASKTVRINVAVDDETTFTKDVTLDKKGLASASVDLSVKLSEGYHDVTVTNPETGAVIIEKSFGVYDNSKFYTDYQYGYIDYVNSEIYVYVESDQIYGENCRKSAGYSETTIDRFKDASNYVVDLYDKNGTLIRENASVTSLSTSGRYAYLHVKLTEDELDYTGMYVRIAFKTGDTADIGVSLVNAPSYYYSTLGSSQGSAAIGRWTSRRYTGRGYLYTNDTDGYHGVYMAEIEDESLFPVNLYLYKVNSGKEVTKLTIKKSDCKVDSDGTYYYYYFTKTFAEKYKNNLYDVILIGNDGYYMDKEQGYITYTGAKESYDDIGITVDVPENETAVMPVASDVTAVYTAEGSPAVSAALTGTYVFDGLKKTPEIKLTTASGTALTYKTDYTVSYKNNKNANMVYDGISDGVYQFHKDTSIADKKQPCAVITFKGAYKGLKKQTMYFNIYPRNINDAQYAGTILSKKNAKTGEISAKTGKAFTFLKKATVMLPNNKGAFKAKNLNAKKDIDPSKLYIVECDENGNITGDDAYDTKRDVYAAGETYYTISITGMGNYFGTKTGDVFKLVRK